MSVNKQMKHLGEVRSVIRETFEYGKKRAAEIGSDKVFDFSLGNPSVPAPDCVEQAILKLLETTSPTALHGYTSAPGDMATREAIAKDLRDRYGADIDAKGIYMTCGAAASLTSTIHALAEEGDEFMVVAPFFPEYRVFVEKAGGKLVVIPAETKGFTVDIQALRSAITSHTKALILNTPNNPTGVVLSKAVLEEVCQVLREASHRFGHTIYLITDEPYRELVYDDVEVPFIPALYDATVICYSFSKSLSLPGERIGYVAIPSAMPKFEDLVSAVAGAGRALGFVCAPSLMQKVIPFCLGQTSSLSAYKENRDILYDALTKYGFSLIYPQGAFYLFMQSPMADAKAFCQKAREYELLLVPADSFGVEGYVRISYCVSKEMICASLSAFEALAKDLGLS